MLSLEINRSSAFENCDNSLPMGFRSRSLFYLNSPRSGTLVLNDVLNDFFLRPSDDNFHLRSLYFHYLMHELP